MALSTAKLTELQIPLPSHLLRGRKLSSFPLFLIRPFSSSLCSKTNTRISSNLSNPPHKPKSHSSSWLNKWPSPPPPAPPSVPPPKASSKPETRVYDETSRTGTTAIERIVLRLRNLGLGSDGEDEGEEVDGEMNLELSSVSDYSGMNGQEKLGDLLQRDWVRPDTILAEDEDDKDYNLLPWERGVEEEEEKMEEDRGLGRRKAVKAPTLAELTIEDEELRRLRRNGMILRERINVPKAGITGAILEKIHDKWRKNELVRLKFHEALAHDMKTAHEIVERRTGGLVIWRAGSVMVVYRGVNYEGPGPRPQPLNHEGGVPFVPIVSSSDNSVPKNAGAVTPILERRDLVLSPCTEEMTEEEVEFNRLLDSLGPRFEDWWGTGILPVDADLLPQTIPGYKTPFRLLPTGMRSRLTNAEMTNLRKLAKSLPCHFALGRNRNHQGLAAAIIKLWEKSLIAKIAVKRGIQNTNNKLMAEELRTLTGGVLLLRNKYYIVIYRGKDFLPPSVAAALLEREEMAKRIQDVEEKARGGAVAAASVAAAPLGRQEMPKQIQDGEEGVQDGSVEAVSTAAALLEREEITRCIQDTAEKVKSEPLEEISESSYKEPIAGTLAEFYEAQARWGRNISDEERRKMTEEASKAKTAKIIRSLEHKLAIAQAKKLKAERLLSKIIASWVPVTPSDDQETITDEERVMYRRVGLRMKAYLPLGIRGVFDGVIENMHLHWKHRELVKLLSKEKELAFVEETARLLEYESGGILVAIERVPKGYALIFYRGKNYRRPVTLRPRNLLTKAKALKRRVALQRYEALSQHISELERTVEQTKQEIGDSKDTESSSDWNQEDDGQQLRNVSEFTQSEDEASWMDSDGDEDGGEDWEDNEDSDFSSIDE